MIPRTFGTRHIRNRTSCRPEQDTGPAWSLPTSRLRACALLLLSMLFIAGCGQVITVQPTPTPEPTATLEVAMEVATLPPTSTPAPYTPAPTPTPTITPTPILHTIASGESLLSVAGRFGVSVAALQDANGILDPRFLQIGQQIIIPRPEEVEDAESQSLTPTPTPYPMEVQNVYFNESNIGGLWVLGEALNTSAEMLEQVRVGITLLDENDVEIARTEGLVALDLVPSGQTAPFAIAFGEQPGEFARYRLFATHAVPAFVGSYYRDLAVENIQYVGERNASYTVTGLIRNFGPEEAVEVEVVLTAYDPLGRIIAMRKVTPDHNVIAPGGETPFTAVIAPVGGPVQRVAAVAQARRATSQQ